MANRDDVRRDEGWREVRRRGVLRGEFFSLGALFVPYVKTRTSFAPWTLSAAILLTLSCWDPIASGGRFDAILFGLAAYELLIGLTRPDERHPVRVAATQPGGRRGR